MVPNRHSEPFKVFKALENHKRDLRHFKTFRHVASLRGWCLTIGVRIERRRRKPSDREPVSTEENNLRIVRRVIGEGVNAQDLSVFDELISPSFIDHEAEGSQPGGPEGEKELLKSRKGMIEVRKLMGRPST